MPFSATIQRLAADNGAVLSLQQALAADIPKSAVDHELKVGRLVPVHPGVYRSAGAPFDRHVALRAALLAAGTGAVLSHRTAASLHGLLASDPSLIELTVGHDRRPRLQGVRLHRSLRLPDAHRRTIDGLAVTSVDRTLADLGAVIRPALVQSAVEAAVVARQTTVPRLLELVDDHGRRGRNGIGALRLALEEWMLSERPPDSVLEIAFARLVRREGLPTPVYQHWVEVDGKRYRIDAAWPEQMLAVEVDGWETRKTFRAFQSDTSRQNRLTLGKWMVIRFTWTDVVRRPAYVAGQIAAALALSGT